MLGVKASHAPAGPADDLTRLKGVGPKFAARLNELGITRYDQLAGLNANEVAHLDERMGPFQGRLARDRVIEQADSSPAATPRASRRRSASWAARRLGVSDYTTSSRRPFRHSSESWNLFAFPACETK